MIQTVKGKMDAKDLGVTMCHEHLALNLTRVRGDDDSDFSCETLVMDEVRKMMALGGVQSVVEVTCNDMGRDVRALERISEACGLHIICATGFYLQEYHPGQVQDGSVAEICDIFCQDIEEGIDGTDIKAGVIGEVASSWKEIYPDERKVLKAAAQAAVRTGLAVTTHCHLGTMALEQSALLQQEGMDPGKIILGHLDLTGEREYYLEVLKTGVNLGFDTIEKRAYRSDEQRADLVLWLLEKGYEDRLVLSQDISRKSYFSVHGEYSGYMSVMKNFVPLLRQKGVTEASLDKLLVGNPERIFDI